MKICDLRLSIDGVILRDGENIDDLIKKIEAVVETSYDIQVDVIMRRRFDG